MVERRLHIGIDGRELVGRPTGVGRYLWHVLREWSTAAPTPHRLTVFLPEDVPAGERQAFPGVHWVIDAGRPRGGTLWEQLRLPRLLARAAVDVLFAVGYTAPLRSVCPVVVVTHDVSFMAHPEWFRWRERWRRRWLTAATARAASVVLTVSEFSAAEITRCTGVARARMRLAPPGAPPVTAGSGGPPRGRVVLYVGSIFNRRRVPTLIEAFAAVARHVPDARLVLVGDNRTEPPVDLRAAAAALGIGARVDWLEYVEDDQLGRLYDSARVFAFLSEYEGFAMTPLEAIAHGAPAVMLDTPVAREIYGEGATLVPDDVPRIAAALTSLLTNDEAHAAALRAGRARLSRYSWARTAAVILEALEQAAQ